MLAPVGEGDIWSARFGAEYSSDFDDLQRIGGNLLIENATPLGVDTEFNYFRENLDDGSHDVAAQMSDLIVAQRSYQMNLQVSRAGEEAYQSALRIGRH